MHISHIIISTLSLSSVAAVDTVTRDGWSRSAATNACELSESDNSSMLVFGLLMLAQVQEKCPDLDLFGEEPADDVFIDCLGKTALEMSTDLCNSVPGLSTFSVDVDMTCDSNITINFAETFDDIEITQGLNFLCVPDECTKDDWVNLVESKNEGCTLSAEPFTAIEPSTATESSTSSSGFSRVSTIGGMCIILAGTLALL